MRWCRRRRSAARPARGSARPCPRPAPARTCTADPSQTVDAPKCGATSRGARRELLHGRDRRRRGRVDAADRVERRGLVRVLPARSCGRCTRRRAASISSPVAAAGLRERGRERRRSRRAPAYSALATPMSSSPGPSVRCSPSTVAGHRAPRRSCAARSSYAAAGSPPCANAHVGVGAAVIEERVEIVVEALGLIDRASAAYDRAGSTTPSSTIARTRCGNTVGVPRADQRAVREADVADLLRRRSRPGSRRGRGPSPPSTRTGADRALLLLARVDERCATRDVLRDRGRSVRDRGRRRRTGRGRRGTAPARSAPSPRGSHDTRSNESRISGGNDVVGVAQEVDARAAGTAGIREQHADRACAGAGRRASASVMCGPFGCA